MKTNPGNNYAWAIVGAGPAGIVAVGKLLDKGVLPESILWIDPAFQVGDLGAKWRHVSSNTEVSLLLKSLHSSPSLLYQDSPIDFSINHLPPDAPCELVQVVEPLQWMSNHLKDKVHARSETIVTLKQNHDRWCLITKRKEPLYAKNIVLATGAEPIVHPDSTPLIPLEAAMDPALLRLQCDKNDTVGVLGSSHSALVALYNLCAIPVARILHFYRSPLRYAVDMGSYIVHDNTGLRGYAAQWAKQYLVKSPPENLERVYTLSGEYAVKRQSCTKLIQAIGFKRRQLPEIQPYGDLPYNPATGILAPGLFGTGFAYPLMTHAKPGLNEYGIGIWDFVLQLDEVLPLWLRYSV